MNIDEIVEIILIEDNAADAELTMRALAGHNLKNKIILLRDGEEAIEFLLSKGRYTDRNQRNKPKVIILDLKLPKIDGLDVLRTIKNDPNLNTVPVVMLTSSKEERDIIRSYQLGVNSYIVKPVEFDKFADAVKDLGYYWMLLNEPPVS